MEGRQSGQAVFGLVLMFAGTALLLERAGIFAVDGVWRLWPGILIAMGVSRVFEAPLRRRHDGVWLIMLGTWLLLNMLDVLRWDQSWPLVIVAIGINMVLRVLSGVDARAAEGRDEQ